MSVQPNATYYFFDHTRLLPKTIKGNGGQALAELIIACAILAIVLFGIVTTINFSVNASSVAANKTRSIHYAQEGLELARAARNAGWDTFVANSFLNGENNKPITGTIFSRTISIEEDNPPVGSNDRTVTSTVTWFDGTTQYETRLVTVLTNR